MIKVYKFYICGSNDKDKLRLEPIYIKFKG